jgi:hypothetical protein
MNVDPRFQSGGLIPRSPPPKLSDSARTSNTSSASKTKDAEYMPRPLTPSPSSTSKISGDVKNFTPQQRCDFYLDSLTDLIDVQMDKTLKEHDRAKNDPNYDPIKMDKLINASQLVGDFSDKLQNIRDGVRSGAITTQQVIRTILSTLLPEYRALRQELMNVTTEAPKQTPQTPSKKLPIKSYSPVLTEMREKYMQKARKNEDTMEPIKPLNEPLEPLARLEIHEAHEVDIATPIAISDIPEDHTSHVTSEAKAPLDTSDDSPKTQTRKKSTDETMQSTYSLSSIWKWTSSKASTLYESVFSKDTTETVKPKIKTRLEESMDKTKHEILEARNKAPQIVGKSLLEVDEYKRSLDALSSRLKSAASNPSISTEEYQQIKTKLENARYKFEGPQKATTPKELAEGISQGDFRLANILLNSAKFMISEKDFHGIINALLFDYRNPQDNTTYVVNQKAILKFFVKLLGSSWSTYPLDQAQISKLQEYAESEPKLQKALDRYLSGDISSTSVSTDKSESTQPADFNYFFMNSGNYGVRVKEAADDLKLLQAQSMSRLSVDEFTNEKWSKKPVDAPNVVNNTKIFNNITNYFTYFILSEPIETTRAEKIKFVIDIANKCLKNKDYASALAINAAFNSTPIARLIKNNPLIGVNHVRVLNKLEIVFSMDGNFKNLRSLQSKANSIPYLGNYLGDLTFVNENPTEVVTPDNQKKINTSKFATITNIITNIKNGIKTGESYTQKRASPHTNVGNKILRYSPANFPFHSKADKAKSDDIFYEQSILIQKDRYPPKNQENGQSAPAA